MEESASDLPSHLQADVPPSQLSVATLKDTLRPHSSLASSPGVWRAVNSTMHLSFPTTGSGHIIEKTFLLHIQVFQGHRLSINKLIGITGYLKLEEIHKDDRVQPPCSSRYYLKLNHLTKGIIQMLFERWQVWCRGHPGESVPVTDHPLSEEPFPNVQWCFMERLWECSFPQTSDIVIWSKNVSYSWIKALDT